jgi:hypothetical protein
MTDSIMYYEGNRRLQDQFDSRRISDRPEKFTRTQFNPTIGRLSRARRISFLQQQTLRDGLTAPLTAACRGSWLSPGRPS